MSEYTEQKGTDDFLKVSREEIFETSLSGLNAYNLSEITKHKTKDDIWIILNQRVYDISNILVKHPGGEEIVINQIQISQNVTAVFYKMQHSVDALSLLKGHCIGTVDKEIVGWGDLFSVKIEILDKQHHNLLDIMNGIYCNGNINDLHKFIVAWGIHCETEEYLMKTYNFATDMKSSHIKDHERISTLLQKLYDDLVKKYSDKLQVKTDKDDEKNNIINGEVNIHSKNDKNEDKNKPFRCQELIDFSIAQMGSIFKKHSFQYDTLYVDHLEKIQDPSASFKTENDNIFGLTKPIFPKTDSIQ